MSDTPPAGEALRRLLARCSSGPECPCGGSGGGSGGGRPRTAVASPLSPDMPSSESSEQPSSGSSSGSEDWGGLESLTIEECEHNLMCILRKCCLGVDAGRRFLGCPLEIPSERCSKIVWVDEPWPDRVQATLSTMYEQMRNVRRRAGLIRNRLVATEREKEAVFKEVEDLRASVTHTQRVAEQVCLAYRRKATCAIIDKLQFMYVFYCILGLAPLQAGALFFKK